MDAKQTDLLGELHSRFVAGNFGETDVHSLLALLREDSPKGGIVRELGDFIGHRSRDKGPVQQYANRVKTILDRLGTQNELLGIGEIFKEDDIATAVDAALSVHGLERLSIERHRQIQVAILSTLQRVSLFAGKAKIGHLEIAIGRDSIQLLGVVSLCKPQGAKVAFPVLSVKNDCYPMHAPHAKIKPADLLKVRVRDGRAILEGVKAYEIHIGRKRERGKDEPLPLTWAEVAVALGNAPVNVRDSDGEFDVSLPDGRPVTFKFRDGRLSFAGRTEHFAPESSVWRIALMLKLSLDARVFDDTGGFLFETVQTLNTLQPE